jgi:delta-aminolevulinic acid dehydratase/porphobilinogen synthase
MTDLCTQFKAKYRWLFIKYLGSMQCSTMQHKPVKQIPFVSINSSLLKSLCSMSGAFTLREGVMESLAGMRRAGANILISYFTPDVLTWLKNGPSSK